jgi:uncharacterized membrane protein
MRVALALVVLALFSTACGSGPSLVAEAGFYRIPMDGLDDGKARHYKVKAGGREVAFFVVKSPDGVVRAAFDACDECYRARKGYVQEGEQMVCVNCGQRFHVGRINEVKGGCNPAPLKRTVSGSMLLIAESDVAEGAFYF